MKNRYLNVPGAQLTSGEREWLKSTAALIATLYKDTTIVNVGVMWGASMWCLREGAPTAKLVGIDIDLRRNRTDVKERIWDETELKATLLQADSRTYPFEGDIHFLFLDGDHHYAVITADIANWAWHVIPRGIIAFHDYAPTAHNLKQFPELEGVKRAADELAATDQWKPYAMVDSIKAYRRNGNA